MRTIRSRMTPPASTCWRSCSSATTLSRPSRVSALCRRFRTAFSDLPEHLGPEQVRTYQLFLVQDKQVAWPSVVADRLCAALLLPHHPRTPGDAGVYRPSPTALHPPDDSESGGSSPLADHVPQPETPGHPHHALCRGAAGVRTVPVADHRYRQRAHGPPGTARQRPARSVCHAAPKLLPLLRQYWQQSKPRPWLFPGNPRTRPMTTRGV